jgi:hypothetical protein
MMKSDRLLKIIKIASASLTAAAFIVGLCVLLLSGDEGEVPETPKDIFDVFTENFDQPSVKKVTYNVSYKESGITLNGKYTVVFSTDNGVRNITLEYKYDKLNAIGENDEMISTLTGIIAASGEDEIRAVFGEMNLPYSTAFAKEDFESYVISENRLTVKISDGALGEGSKNISMTLDRDAYGRLDSFELAYEDENASTVSVKAKLEYKN